MPLKVSNVARANCPKAFKQLAAEDSEALGTLLGMVLLSGGYATEDDVPSAALEQTAYLYCYRVCVATLDVVRAKAAEVQGGQNTAVRVKFKDDLAYLKEQINRFRNLAGVQDEQVAVTVPFVIDHISCCE